MTHDRTHHRHPPIAPAPRLFSLAHQGLAVRLEGKSMSYIETVNSTTLEMKNNFIVQANVSFFFPGMK